MSSEGLLCGGSDGAAAPPMVTFSVVPDLNKERRLYNVRSDMFGTSLWNKLKNVNMRSAANRSKAFLRRVWGPAGPKGQLFSAFPDKITLPKPCDPCEQPCKFISKISETLLGVRSRPTITQMVVVQQAYILSNCHSFINSLILNHIIIIDLFLLSRRKILQRTTTLFLPAIHCPRQGPGFNFHAGSSG